MNPQIKLALRRFALRWLRKMVDVADDRLHAAEVTLREDIAGNSHGIPTCEGTAERPALSLPLGVPANSFAEWDLRRSGIIVDDSCRTPGKSKTLRSAHRRRVRPSAKDFDSRFGVFSQPKPKEFVQ